MEIFWVVIVRDNWFERNNVFVEDVLGVIFLIGKVFLVFIKFSGFVDSEVYIMLLLSFVLEKGIIEVLCRYVVFKVGE